MKVKSKFGAWFKEQFGALPNEAKRRRLDIKVHELESALFFARQEYEKEMWLAEKFDAALKGWNASPDAAGGESNG